MKDDRKLEEQVREALAIVRGVVIALISLFSHAELSTLLHNASQEWVHLQRNTIPLA